jgi:hypothetical protein
VNWLRGGLVGIGTASVALGCHLLLDLQSPEAGEPVPFASDAGGTPDATDAGPDPCVARFVPPPPAKDDAPTVNLPEQYFAVIARSLTRPDGQLVRLNVDGLRSCAESSNFEPNRRACVPVANPEAGCDLDSCGGENQLGELSGDGGVDTTTAANASASAGLAAFMIYVAGYNGEANDKSVTVGLTRSVGIYSDEGCDGKSRGRKAQSSTARPRLPDGGRVSAYRTAGDGCDRWLLPSDGLVQGASLEPLFAVTGTVTDHVLVARSSARAPFPVGADLAVSLNETILVARIDRARGDAGGPEAFLLSDVIVGARLPLKEFLPGIGSLSVGGTFLCVLPDYKDLAKTLCAAADLTGSANTDDGELSCDSVSAVFSMVAEPARPTRDAGGITFQPRTDCAESLLLKSCTSL